MIPTLLLAALASAPAPQQGRAGLEAAYHGRTRWERLGLEGYSGASSVRVGEELAFHVSSPYPYRVEFFRIAEDEKLLQVAEDLPASVQPIGENVYETGCDWEASFYLPVPETWRSGLHVARLKSSETDDYDIPFIVRPSARGPKRRILSISPDITVQAYNSYGGRNIYATPFGRMNSLLSFDRPLDPLSPGTLDEQWGAYQIDYWMQPKRCTLWTVDPQALTVTPVMDLPSRGDTCFAEVLESAGEYIVYNYSSLLEGPDLVWQDAQLEPTFIYRMILSIP